MKTGVIFYVKANCDVEDIEEIKKQLKDSFPDVDEVEVALPPESEEDMWQAWWRLTTKGMKRILLRFVEIGEGRNFKTGKEMKLVG